MKNLNWWRKMPEDDKEDDENDVPEEIQPDPR